MNCYIDMIKKIPKEVETDIYVLYSYNRISCNIDIEFDEKESEKISKYIEELLYKKKQEGLYSKTRYNATVPIICLDKGNINDIIKLLKELYREEDMGDTSLIETLETLRDTFIDNFWIVLYWDFSLYF